MAAKEIFAFDDAIVFRQSSEPDIWDVFACVPAVPGGDDALEYHWGYVLAGRERDDGDEWGIIKLKTGGSWFHAPFEELASVAYSGKRGMGYTAFMALVQARVEEGMEKMGYSEDVAARVVQLECQHSHFAQLALEVLAHADPAWLCSEEA